MPAVRIFPLLLLLLLTAPVFSAGQQIKSQKDVQQAETKILSLKDDQKRDELLLDIGRYYLNLQGEIKSDLLKALDFEKQAFALANRIHYQRGLVLSFLLKADILRESGDLVTPAKIIHQAIGYASSHGMLAELAAAYDTMSGVYGIESIADVHSKITYSRMAVTYYSLAGDRRMQARKYQDIGEYYALIGNSIKAVELLDSALIVFKSVGHKELQGVYNNLCISYTSMGDYGNALKNGLLAEKTAMLVGDSSLQKSAIFNHIGIIYHNLGSYEKAYSYFLEAKRIAEKYHDINYIQTIIPNLVNTAYRLKRYQLGISYLEQMERQYPARTDRAKIRYALTFANAYLEWGQAGKAEPHYTTLYKLSRSLPKDDYDLISIKKVILKKLITDHQFEEARPYMAYMQQQLKRSPNIDYNAKLEYFMYMADSASNQLVSGVEHLKRFKKYSDSASNVQKARQIAVLDIEYETAKKNKDIALLNQKNQLQEARIQSEESARYAFIIGLIAACIIITILYNRYRLKIRSNLQLEQKQNEINGKNTQLTSLLGEKEWLLREIHHRVKNNLQIVISLLNTQSSYLDNEDAKVAIQKSQNRMFAMSLIHQKLYQSNNLSSIDMNWYIRELVGYMAESYAMDSKIQFVLATEPIHLNVAQSVPLGLILNEAVSNCIKYAFPGNVEGKIYISFVIDDDRCTLKISDNGIGLLPDFDFSEMKSLGMSLMVGLAEQLNGILSIRNEDGVVLEISFTRQIAV
ncbi:MAG: histidine kinase dimerization/phosphoacceptor domain -containing protein [Pedobacter sp.]|uniref:tetratricopeptide repeat-containing sensor histidine kinase n=1 Tax=Pedobacter sp. TaxID=1411316 RepID=UPI0033992A88